MKITNLSSRICEQKKIESERINAIDQGIMRRLLEKYKPKRLCDIETKSDRNDEKRVA